MEKRYSDYDLLHLFEEESAGYFGFLLLYISSLSFKISKNKNLEWSREKTKGCEGKRSKTKACASSTKK